MSTTYTITLSDAEAKALNHIAASAQDWIDNVVKDRCRIAIEDIVKAEVSRKLAAGETISGTADEIVIAANIETGAEIRARLMAEADAQVAAQGAIE